VKELSQLHLCRYVEVIILVSIYHSTIMLLLQEEEGWEWLAEECSLHTYNLPKEVNSSCDLKEFTSHFYSANLI